MMRNSVRMLSVFAVSLAVALFAYFPSASANIELVPLNDMKLQSFYDRLASNPEDVKDGYTFTKLEKATEMPKELIPKQMPNVYCCWYQKTVLLYFYCDESGRVMCVNALADDTEKGGPETTDTFGRCLAHIFELLGMTKEELDKLTEGSLVSPKSIWCEKSKRWIRVQYANQDHVSSITVAAESF